MTLPTTWEHPYILLLLLLLPLLLWSQARRSHWRLPMVGFSDLRLVRWSSAVRQRYEGRWPLTLLCLALLGSLLAAAQPEHGIEQQNITSAGIDIMLALDTSTSMEAMDLQPTRIGAAIQVSERFIEGRPNDRIGVVVFGGQALTVCPLSSDHAALNSYLENVKAGMTGVDGTAIGDGLATCLNRLKTSQAKSKVIILLTDGRNNLGEIEPLAAARMAQALGVRIYTIGAATRGEAPFQVRDPMGGVRQVLMQVDLDEDLLQKIATLTGGKYFRATDSESLSNIFNEIDQMEKTDTPKRQVVTYHQLYPWFLGPAMLALLALLLLDVTAWRELP
jgi:Ca-activated chloride channel family protein